MRVKYGVTLRLSGYPLYTFDYNYYFNPPPLFPVVVALSGISISTRG